MFTSANRPFGGELGEKVPEFFLDCLDFIEENPAIGIFRITKNFRNVHTVCGIVKMFFRELPSRFLPVKFNQGLGDVMVLGEQEKLQQLRKRVLELTKTKQTILAKLCSVLHVLTICESEKTKMTPANYSICISPNLGNPLTAVHLNKVLELMITHYPVIFDDRDIELVIAKYNEIKENEEKRSLERRIRELEYEIDSINKEFEDYKLLVKNPHPGRGWLQKGKKLKMKWSWKWRYFVCDNVKKEFAYYISPKFNKPIKLIQLGENYQVCTDDIGGKKHGWAIITTKRIWHFVASNDVERKRWMDYWTSQNKSQDKRKSDGVYEGWLSKKGDRIRSWNLRYFKFDFNKDRFSFYDNNDKRKPIKIVPLNDMEIVDKKDSLQFTLQPKKKKKKRSNTFDLEAVSFEEKGKWMDIIKNVSMESGEDYQKRRRRRRRNISKEDSELEKEMKRELGKDDEPEKTVQEEKTIQEEDKEKKEEENSKEEEKVENVEKVEE